MGSFDRSPRHAVPDGRRAARRACWPRYAGGGRHPGVRVRAAPGRTAANAAGRPGGLDRSRPTWRCRSARSVMRSPASPTAAMFTTCSRDSVESPLDRLRSQGNDDDLLLRSSVAPSIRAYLPLSSISRRDSQRFGCFSAMALPRSRLSSPMDLGGRGRDGPSPVWARAAPRTDPSERDYRTGLPPWVFA